MTGKFKSIACATVGLFLSAACFSQNKKSLTVGDTVPDIEIKRIINYSAPTAKLADFKGKLILLDFWATWCSNCIEAFPKLDSLQKAFKDKVVILPVTSQDEKRAADFWKNNPTVEGNLLPSVVEDTILRSLFPHDGLPHEVWIDGDGVVKAITNGEYVTAENIQAVLNGKDVDWMVHLPRNRDFKVEQPLIKSSKNGSYPYDIRNYTVLTKHIKGVSRKYGIMIDSIGKTKRFYAINNSITDLFNVIMRYHVGYYTKNRIVLETSDTSRYYYDNKMYRDQWLFDNTYCYETVLPITTPDSTMAAMILKDLNKFLDINASIVKRTVPCLIVRKNGGVFGKQNGNGGNEGKNERFVSLKNIVNTLNLQPGNPPVIDETGLNKKTRLKVGLNSWSDLASIQKVLKSQGIELLTVERQVDILVVKDVPAY